MKPKTNARKANAKNAGMRTQKQRKQANASKHEGKTRQAKAGTSKNPGKDRKTKGNEGKSTSKAAIQAKLNSKRKSQANASEHYGETSEVKQTRRLQHEQASVRQSRK